MNRGKLKNIAINRGKNQNGFMPQSPHIVIFDPKNSGQLTEMTWKDQVYI